MPRAKVLAEAQGAFLSAQEEFQKARIDLLHAQETLFAFERKVPTTRRDDVVFSKSHCVERLAQIVACTLSVDNLFGRGYRGGQVPSDERRSLLLRFAGYANSRLKFFPMEFIQSLEAQARQAEAAAALVQYPGQWVGAEPMAHPDVLDVEVEMDRVLMTTGKDHWVEATEEIESWIVAFREFFEDYVVKYRAKQAEYERLMESGDMTLKVLGVSDPVASDAPAAASAASGSDDRREALSQPVVVTTPMGDHYLTLGLLSDTFAHFRLVALKTPDAIQAAKASIVEKAQALRRTLMEMDEEMALFSKIRKFIDEVEDLVRRKSEIS